MPNWVSNSVTVTAPNENALNAFLDAVRSEDNPNDPFSFNRIIPMPSVLNGTQSPCPKGEFDPDGKIWAQVNDPNSRWDEAVYNKNKEEHDAARDAGAAAKEATGYDNWYDWSFDHWGTKWDVRECHLAVDGVTATIRFDTAWSPPHPVMDVIAATHPELHIHWRYDEEQGWGGEHESCVDDQEMQEVRSWDIPDSHDTYEDARQTNCRCYTDPEFRFDDCWLRRCQIEGLDERLTDTVLRLGYEDSNGLDQLDFDELVELARLVVGSETAGTEDA